jgi:heparan sulfate 6-O-sulfotransferase HS6ST1
LKITLNFDENKDTLILFHIQKTSGSNFEKQIWNNLQIKQNNQVLKVCSFDARKKTYKCILNSYKQPIYFNRYVLRMCDIHATFAELKYCVQNVLKDRSYVKTLQYQDINERTNKQQTVKFNVYAFDGQIHYLTFLRNPIDRYLSEYLHVKRGATWRQANRICNSQDIYANNCYKGAMNWKSITSLDEFINCDYNQANNRMTRMLADYDTLGCSILRCWTESSNCSRSLKKELDEQMLNSAMKTLENQIGFFGLNEYQNLSYRLFERVYNGKFIFSNETKFLVESNRHLNKATKEQIYLIHEKNNLDIRLYKFAKKLFFMRLQSFEIYN